MSYQVYPPPDPSRHYQSHYGPPAAQHHSVQLPKPPSVPHRLPPPPPDFASVTPQIASQTVQRLISSQLRDAGYEAAQPQALRRLEIEVAAFVELLYGRAHEYANLANRAGPIATDLLLASEGCGMQTRDLHKLGAKSSKKRKRGRPAATLLPPPSRSPSPELLLSDDEDAPPVVPLTLRALPTFLPALPPKHTYLRTPASAPKKAALPSLEKKLKTAGLVQESLQHLLLGTEDNLGHEDGELLGHIVNWEASTHPRKRWKIGA